MENSLGTFSVAPVEDSGGLVQKVTQSRYKLTETLETADVAPVKYYSGYDFQAIESMGMSEDLKGCCVFASLATAIERAGHTGSPSITVNSQDVRKIRDSFTSELKSLINMCLIYIKSISFDEESYGKGEYKPIFEFSEPKTEEGSDDQKKTLCRYIRALGKGKDVDALMQKLPEVTKTSLDTMRADFDKRRADFSKRRADLDKRKADLNKRLADLNERWADGSKRLADLLTEAQGISGKKDKRAYNKDMEALNKDWEALNKDWEALNKDWEAYKKDIMPHLLPSKTWCGDENDLAFIFIKLEQIMGSLCYWAKQSAEEANEKYNPERWYESAALQAERIGRVLGLYPAILVVLGMMPDPEGNEGKLFCDQFVLNLYGLASKIPPTGTVGAGNSLPCNMLIKLDDNNRYFYEEGHPKEELNVLACPNIEYAAENGKECWKTQ